EVYLYLSTPLLEIFPGIRLRSFISAQTEIANTERKTSAAETENTEGDIDNTDDHDGTENTGDADEAYSSGGQNQITRHAFSGGLDFAFGRGSRLLFETFYTAATLAPVKASSWFSNPPPLPERDTYLYAAGILFTCPDFSISGDFAFSETFIWGTGIYADIGVNFTPALSFGSRARPLSISLAADGSGGRFINRDGGSLNEGFRSAVKIEWKGRYNFLVRFNTVLRSQAFGENFNRSSTGFYWRFPSSGGIFRITRISLSADRNAANPAKINDSFSAAAGFSINMRQIGIQNPLGIAISGSLKGLDNADWNEIPCPYPIPGGTWRQESASAGCDLYWSPSIFQFRTGFGATWFAEKKEKWDFSISMAIRFGFGRLSIRAASSNLPENWTYTVSWRMEYQ
ncbi:MAG: hypothetical protein FWB83_08605, partial [Treponema sp.]|nr:hypothetical protein [Treponema sp.]